MFMCVGMFQIIIFFEAERCFLVLVQKDLLFIFIIIIKIYTISLSF